MAADVPDVYVRLEGLTGECLDYDHDGDDGWIQIKGFGFSFGLKSAAKDDKKKDAKSGKDKDKDGHGTSSGQSTDHSKSSTSTDDGPFERPEVTLSKNLDYTSTSIWKQKCYDGEAIPILEVQACRYGGEIGEEKIPFVRMVFKNVVVRSVSLQVSPDGMPSESIQFMYDEVHMQYTWTANDTGSRVRGANAPRAGWNFTKNKPAPWPLSE